DAQLYGREQERVVVRARVARRPHVAPDVESARKAAPEQLRDERKQRKRESGEEPEMPPRALHAVSLPDWTGPVQTLCAFANMRCDAVANRAALAPSGAGRDCRSGVG